MDHFFYNKKVLIVGGTGTIGRSILESVLVDRPAVVRILSRDEHKQFELQQEYANYTNIRYLIGDVRDYNRVYRAMQDIDYVFHAAAMKHVSACEYNPFEAVQTNIIGTQNIIQASLECNVTKTVFTSTDKAISPTNTYGASKLMAERLISSAQYQSGAKNTKFSAVRFGNVMGSRGSVIPLFQQQIVTKRYVTLTSHEMTRFMMTKKQATELTIRAMMRAQGGEVFVLKMPVIRMSDLCECVIEETAKTVGIHKGDIGIEVIGLRPGEKMFEELMSEEESIHAFELDDMFVIANEFLGKYENREAVRAAQQSYSSHTSSALNKEQVRSILLDNHLLNLTFS